MITTTPHSQTFEHDAGFILDAIVLRCHNKNYFHGAVGGKSVLSIYDRFTWEIGTNPGTLILCSTGDVPVVADNFTYVAFDIPDIALSSHTRYSFVLQSGLNTDGDIRVRRAVTNPYPDGAYLNNADHPENLNTDLPFYLIQASPLPPTPYEAWIGSFGLNGVESATTNDYDGDGLNNLYEYAQGGSPHDGSNTAYQISIQPLNTNAFLCIHPARSDPGSGWTYSLEFATDLVAADWAYADYAATGTNRLDAQFNVVTNQPATTGPWRFIRLKVELTD